MELIAILWVVAQAAVPATTNQIVISIVIALIGGGAGLKFVEYIMGRGKVKVDEASQLRSEMRKEIADLRTELRVVEQELDTWKLKYFRLVNKISSSSLEIDLTELLKE
jgi:hypothetical protein